MDKIAVYDNEGRRVGSTYPRRAKQLVMKQKAVWQDVNHKGISLVDMLDSANYEEDKHMEADNTIEVKEGALASEMGEAAEELAVSVDVEEISVKTPSEDLLMYLAKQNVKKRHNLFLNIVLFPVVLIVLAIITGGFNSRSGLNAAFYAGVFFSWGMIILYKFGIVIRAWLASRSSVQREDPVKAEYERLRNSSPDKIKV